MANHKHYVSDGCFVFEKNGTTVYKGCAAGKSAIPTKIAESDSIDVVEVTQEDLDSRTVDTSVLTDEEKSWLPHPYAL